MSDNMQYPTMSDSVDNVRQGEPGGDVDNPVDTDVIESL